MKDKLLSIQVLRAYACYIVIISHLILQYRTVYNGFYVNNGLTFTDYLIEKFFHGLNFGPLGVIQFFFISGFVITMVAMRENRFEFIVKRFFRLFPPILFSLIIIAILYNVLHYTNMTKVLEGGGYMHME